VERLSKQYKLGERQQYKMLRDVLSESLGRPFRQLSYIWRRGQPPTARGAQAPAYIWALKDLSFEIRHGEVVGVIGRNGAGKSTLLKILSRITKPTSGYARVRGRVGSLLEVGTGFHPELTGQENIYLNGAILGMDRPYITRRMDEIVAFAGLEQFLDTPVKRYSSGMYMRLAFAVAAHLEPEILIVDEVLAVGDAEFQKKCLGKMEAVSKEGRTVLFVSHNMDAIRRLCQRTMLFEQGVLLNYGNTHQVVDQYLMSRSYDSTPANWIDVSKIERIGTRQAYVSSIWYSSLEKQANLQPYTGGPLEFQLHVMSDRNRSIGSVAVTLYDQNGIKLINADTVSLGVAIHLHEGENVVRLRLKQLHLKPGTYLLGWWLSDPLGDVFDFSEAAVELQVVAPQTVGFGSQPATDGVVACDFELMEPGMAWQSEQW
jgi:ABC-type polysaccharide/polyol phosphate transport system ATPase subunit